MTAVVARRTVVIEIVWFTTPSAVAGTARFTSPTGWKSSAWADSRQTTGIDGSGRSTITVASIRLSETTVYAATLAETTGSACTSAVQINQVREPAAMTPMIPI